jgi:hypothetical protein
MIKKFGGASIERQTRRISWSVPGKAGRKLTEADHPVKKNIE